MKIGGCANPEMVRTMRGWIGNDAVGVVAGAVGAIVLGFVERRRLVAPDWLQVIPLSAAALSYGIAAPLGGSGFFAAKTHMSSLAIRGWFRKPPPARRTRLSSGGTRVSRL